MPTWSFGHKEEEIIGVLNAVKAGSTILPRRSGALCKWIAKCGGLEVFEAKRLRVLENENARLKRLFAGTMFREIGQKIVTLAARQAAHLQETFSVNQRWAYEALYAESTVVRCKSRRAGGDGIS